MGKSRLASVSAGMGISACCVAALLCSASSASAALQPGNILLNPDMEMAETGPNIFNVPEGWFRSSNSLDNVNGIGETGTGPVLWGGYWNTDESVSPTHSLGLLDVDVFGSFFKTEWRSWAAPMPAGTTMLKWSFDVMYDIDPASPVPEFSVHARTDGPFSGTGNLTESPNLIDTTLTLTGNTGGQFVTMTLDVPIVSTSNGSYDIIFRTQAVNDSFETLGTMFIDNVSVVPVITGDLDGDGFVGISDLNIILGNWNLNVPPANPLADPSGDGFVGIDDLNQVLGNWNAGTPPAPAAVPEPGSLAALLTGVFALSVRRHRAACA
jgi:hypothetical protein